MPASDTERLALALALCDANHNRGWPGEAIGRAIGGPGDLADAVRPV